MQTLNNTFEARAARLGHDITALKAGQTINTQINVTDIDQLKAILDDGQPDDKKIERAASLLGPLPKTIGTSEADLQQRAGYYIYGGAELSQEDRQALAGAFPLQVAAVSAENITYDKPTTLGISQPRMIFNYGTVTINEGGCISINNTELEYTTDNLIRNGNPPNNQYDINILGVRGNDGIPGRNGNHGVNGAPGRAGAHGGNASSGTHGTDGLPSKLAIINITNSIQCNNGKNLTVYTASGAGGNGGDGGRGGDGGDGNKAAGGIGGHGGNGGNAGNGINAEGNVMVYVNINDIGSVEAIYGEAPFGQFGKKGNGGQGGDGVPKRAPNGDDGVDGQPGTINGSHAIITVRPY